MINKVKIDVKSSVQEKNKIMAEDIRKTLKDAGIRSFNLMGSIGAGKTTLIGKLSKILADNYKILVINGDWTTEWQEDMTRILSESQSKNVTAVQVNTYGASGCHLTAKDIKEKLIKEHVVKNGYNLVMIENVGNLICPSSWDLGMEKRIVMVSVTEGPYMVKKHSGMFNKGHIAVINKVELADIMEVDVDLLVEDVHAVNPSMKVIQTSAKNEEGLEELIKVLGL